MFHTSLTKLLNLSFPLIQAPMAGGGDTVELVAVVSEAGALGSIGAAYLSPEQIIDRGRQVRAQTARPFAINLFAPTPVPLAHTSDLEKALQTITPYFEELGLPAPVPPKRAQHSFDDQFAASIETGAAVFSFTFGMLPERAVREAKRRKLILMGTATTVAEAQALAEVGADAVVAQGIEAGGHRGTFSGEFESGMVGLISLVPQITDAVPIPVVASGGIMDGRGIVAALALGASAVQMGTAFLTCSEAGISEAYKLAILNAKEDQTRITRAFSGRPARAITNRLLRDYQRVPDAILPFPLQNALTRPLRAEAARQSRSEFLSLWAGQGLRMARKTSAAELIARLRNELSEALDSLRPL